MTVEAGLVWGDFGGGVGALLLGREPFVALGEDARKDDCGRG